jgi:hypothetical protein
MDTTASLGSVYDGTRPLDLVEDEAPPRVLSLRWTPFPIHELPEPYRSYVADSARARQCDPATIALPLLSALGGTIGAARIVQIAPDWTAPPVIWTVIVAPSGAVKSPGFKAALAPVEEIDRRALVEWQEEHSDYEAQRLMHDAEMADWRKKGASRGVPPEAQREPTPERIIVEDTTLQALSGILVDNPRGLLLARDELSGWVRSFGQFTGAAGADLARWLETHRAGPLRVDRKTDGHVYVPRSSVSICGTIQTAILPLVFSGQEQDAGLLARFVVASPPEPTRTWHVICNAKPPDVDALVRRFERLRSLDMPEQGLAPMALVFSEEAKAEYGNWFEGHEKRRSDIEAGSWRAATSKLEELPCRLGLVLSLAKADEPNDVTEISGEAMRSALAITDWAYAEGMRVYSTLSEGSKDRRERELVDWVSRHPAAVTARETAQAHNRFSGPGGTTKAKEELSGLVEAGRLKRVTRKGHRGPTADAYAGVEATPTPTGFAGVQTEGSKPVGVGAEGGDDRIYDI